MLILFQLTTFALIALSFALVVGVPVTLALPDGWSTTKSTVYSGLFLWLMLVFAVGILNSFVV
uniref:Photosystem II reaction center protein Z n=1 Tax=prasinophyte sp. MBIC10622 TaxID=156113 RepID=A0A088CIT8_9CHLO|nr:Z protein of photosystem II [prasinophyte sp. MBIC10622]